MKNTSCSYRARVQFPAPTRSHELSILPSVTPVPGDRIPLLTGTPMAQTTSTPNTSTHKIKQMYLKRKKKEVFCSSSAVTSHCCPQVTMLNGLKPMFLSQAFWRCEISLSYNQGANRAICLPEAWSQVGSLLFC